MARFTPTAFATSACIMGAALALTTSACVNDVDSDDGTIDALDIDAPDVPDDVAVEGGDGDDDDLVLDAGDDPGGDAGGEGVAAQALTASSAPPALQAFFAVPRTGADHTLENEVLTLIASAVPGSSIRISLFQFTRANVAHALVDAQNRGVDVRVVLDRQNRTPDETPAYTILKAGLAAGHVTVCDHNGHGSCIGDGINHSKIFLFSELSDGSREVVVQSSANLTASQMKQHNNMIVSRADHALYTGYLSYWNDLKAQHHDLDYYRTIVGDHRVRAYAFPRASGDTILSVLDNVHCHAGSSTLLVNMAFFADSRVAVADKLVQKKSQGCTVKVNLRDDDTASAPGADVLHTLRHGGVSVKLLPKDDTHFTIHSKTLLVDSAYQGASGVSHRKLVFTGSHNYTAGALRHNDEVLMRVDDPTIFAAYKANWDTVRSLAP